MMNDKLRVSMFDAKISNEDLNKMALAQFPGRIVIIDTADKAEEALARLKSEKIVGIDTETRPSFKRGVVYKVSLMQIATEDTAYLFRLNKIGFPEKLLGLLANKDLVKVGLSLHDDFNGLSKQRKDFKPAGFVDIQSIAKEYGIMELSLQKIYALIFGEKISKAQRLSNWERVELTPQQQMYAATDAWATLMIYKKLRKEKKLSKKEQVELQILDREGKLNAN